MYSFKIVKQSQDADVVEYKQKVLKWLSERLGDAIEHQSFAVYNDVYHAEEWDIEVHALMGKFHNWCMHYLVDIKDEMVAVEFALVKDSL